jgi:hypothetical protein
MGVSENPVKKVYHPPKLIRYGDIGEMTASRLKGTGNADGKSGHKT